MSKLYLLKRMDDVGYDEYKGFVVSADNENEARDLCDHADEGDIWGNQLDVSCTLVALNSTQPKGIVLESFNAG